MIADSKGEEKELSMVFSQPIKQPVKCYAERLRPNEPLVTKIRCIDSFLPVAKGGRRGGMLTLCDLARREECRAECAMAMEAVSANVTRP